MTFLDGFLPQPWLALGVFIAVVIAGFAFREFVFSRFRKWSGSSKLRLDETLIESLHGPILLWVVILAIYAAKETSALSARVTSWADKSLLVLLILSLTVVTARVAARMVRRYAANQAGSVPMGSLTEVLASLAAGLLGLLMILRTLGVDITALLTAFGVGGLAVALALQDTLSNLFAGFYISIAGQIRVGDFIQLDTGQLGYVTDIGWRSTTLRQRSNNLVVIPNNKLAQSTVVNYHLPEHRIMLSLQVGVAFDSDPDRIERVLLDAAQSAEAPGLLKTPAPAVLLMPGFGDRGLEYTVSYHVANYEDQFRAQHEIRKRILVRFREEGIMIPFAMKTVEYTQPPQ
jgi:small-conductance mechanosensitive channel